eukprot:TRINITY_DN497_c0_g2_i1.p1 TRINITY_DN497_c0_g2~~TRINITY_DN497_c0_g2_i1.p1  ORF type:complete len:472 (+),score=98.07 TRINITY_DN497_c0_g2_i1:107-1417(+)
MNVVFIGHVDAGKSTVAGNTLLLTGMVDQRTMEKYEREAKAQKRESWLLAFIMDTNEEERAKGKTVEVGRAHFETPKRRFTILDAPGHKNYVPNMIGGAAQADVAILVISARRGEFETGFDNGGQTSEHTVLAKTLGVDQLIVVINKMDEKTVKWSKLRYDSIIKQLKPFLRQTGFNLKKKVHFIPISGITGANVKERASKDVCDWYDGPSMIELLEVIKTPRRKADDPLRIPILDKYKDAGKVFIEGKVESGTITLGQSVVVMPNADEGKVTVLGTDLAERKKCGPGENIKLVISGVRFSNVSSGFVICSADNQIVPVSRFEAQIYVLELLEKKPILSGGYEAILHAHTAIEECTILGFVTGLDNKGKRTGVRPKFIKKLESAICRIQTSQPICLETYKDNPQLGRFSIRDEGKTIAIGKITSIPKQRSKKRKDK